MHTFRNVGTSSFNVKEGGNVEVLVVAGGGGGGGRVGGGGGAGGLIYSNVFAVTNNGVYTVKVGAGGASGTGTGWQKTDKGANGTNSVFGSLTAIGGGGGGAWINDTNTASGADGGNGGSGIVIVRYVEPPLTGVKAEGGSVTNITIGGKA